MSAVVQADVQVRWQIRRDLAEVLDIEQSAFEFAWTEENFLTALRKRNCIGMVAEAKDKIVGYMIYDLEPNALHVLNFAVMPSLHRSGIGTAMIRKLKNKLGGRNRIALEVRETNLDAQLFFKAQGFEATGVIRGWYEDTDEDAYVMEVVA